MKKLSDIMMLIFLPHVVIHRQKKIIRLLKNDIMLAGEYWSIDRNPKNVERDWIIRNSFHFKPIYSRMLHKTKDRQ